MQALKDLNPYASPVVLVLAAGDEQGAIADLADRLGGGWLALACARAHMKPDAEADARAARAMTGANHFAMTLKAWLKASVSMGALGQGAAHV